jgi:hypothetical protein
MRVPASEKVILTLLIARGPCYGLELVKASRGRLTRGGIYVTLGRSHLSARLPVWVRFPPPAPVHNHLRRS